MIRKTVKRYRRERRGTHDELVEKTTIWLLFIPLYSSERIVAKL